ncbi:MAG: hypothetical protein LBS50_08230 [Prevotellaceae bacterium]|jgi:hypothetical protein|nr:hypothetical protein [Prevotellaceae bacterium]
MKKLVVISMCVCANFMIFAQETENESGAYAQQEQFSTSLYTGGMSLTVPIYTIQDPDFTLPISMTYIANGFMPEQSYDILGNNWHLNAGGVVTRKVFENSDETRLKRHRNGEVFLDKDTVFNTSYFHDGKNYAPDIFSFSINGVSGWFYIDFDGSVKVVADEYFTVDLSELSDQGSIVNTAIKIVDKQGYTYVYGETGLSGYPVEEWHLTQIIAPNGREMNFEYITEKRRLIRYLNYDSGGKKYPYPALWSDVSHTFCRVLNCCSEVEESDEYCRVWNCCPYVEEANEYYFYDLGSPKKNEYFPRVIILQKITIPDVNFEMDFNYLYYTDQYSFIDVLNSIDLKIGLQETENNETLSCNFTYITNAYQASNYPVKFKYLTQYQTFQNTNYKFDYNFENKPTSEEITHSFTYFLNRDDYGYFKPNVFYGTLKKITNTLGGTTVFEYEKHRYSKMKIYSIENREANIVQKDVTANLYYDIYNNIRIKSINTFDEKHIFVATKEYSYIDENSSNLDSLSSGTLHNDFAVILNDNLFSVWDRIYTKNPEPYAVTYSKVTEKTVYTTGKQYKTIYHFFSIDKIQDKLVARLASNACGYWLWSGTICQNIYGFASMSKRRGLLQKKEEFEGLNTLNRVSEYTYQPYLENNYLVSYSQNNGIIKYFYGTSNPTKITTTDYINGNKIVRSTEFDYDTKNRITEQRITGANGRINFTTYRYADDIAPLLVFEYGRYLEQPDFGGLTGGLQQIQRQGWFGRPVEVLNGFYKNSTKYYTGGAVSIFQKQTNTNSSLITYNPPPVFPVLHSYLPMYFLSFQSPYVPSFDTSFATLTQEKALILENPVTNYEQIKYENAIDENNQDYVKVADYQYNDALRLTSKTELNQLTTTYQWDSQNLFPVSETTGNFTTQYTYKAFVGLTFTKDARGVETYNIYDTYTRPLLNLHHKNNKYHFNNLYLYHYYNQQ